MALDYMTRAEVRGTVLKIVRDHPGIRASAILDIVVKAMNWRMQRYSRDTLYRPVDRALQYHRRAGRIRHDRLGKRWGWFRTGTDGELVDAGSDMFETRSAMERGCSVGDKKRGLYRKFRVTRTDGESRRGGKHDGCRYFVLDLDHDQFAMPAIAAYADACELEYPALAADLRRTIAVKAGEAKDE